MSDILIKGMEMPKGLGKTITIYPNGTVRVWVNNKGSGELLEQRAVPVPPHGRVIDADAVGDLLRNKYWNSPWVRSHILDKIVRDIKGFQTIIPADPIKEKTE